MRTVPLPALQRTRVASSFAKRLSVTVTLEVAPDGGAEQPGRRVPGGEAEILGLIEIEKRVAPFLPPERSEQPLEASQSIEIGLWYPAYAIYVTATRPVTLNVTTRAKLRRWMLLAGVVVVVAVCVLSAAVLFQMTR